MKKIKLKIKKIRKIKNQKNLVRFFSSALPLAFNFLHDCMRTWFRRAEESRQLLECFRREKTFDCSDVFKERNIRLFECNVFKKKNIWFRHYVKYGTKAHQFKIMHRIKFPSFIRGHRVYKDKWCSPCLHEALTTRHNDRAEALEYDKWLIGIFYGCSNGAKFSPSINLYSVNVYFYSVKFYFHSVIFYVYSGSELFNSVPEFFNSGPNGFVFIFYVWATFWTSSSKWIESDIIQGLN